MLDSITLVVVNVGATLVMIGVGMIVAILPQRVLDLSGTMQSVSLVASVFALFYPLSQLPNGDIADRFRVKSVLLVGYAL